MKSIKELNEEFQKYEDIESNYPVEIVEDEIEEFDPFKAVIDALKALGVGEPLISQRTPGEDLYEITWKTPSKIFDDSIIRNIASTLEDELNSLF